MSHLLKLNLGCGNQKLPGYINVDKFGQPDVHWDLETFPWPWEDNSVSEILLHHVLEHLGETSAVYLKIIQELYRVCAHNAQISIRVPHPRHDDFLADPTHVRPITIEGLSLLSRQENRRWVAMGASNTPLALYLGVDFQITARSYLLDEPWFSRHEAGELNGGDIEEISRQYNNVVKETRILWRAIKNPVLVEAEQAMDSGNYEQAALLYEQCLEQEPESLSHYWQLGLALFLTGQELEAQTTWFSGLSQVEAEQFDLQLAQLLNLLSQSADSQLKSGQPEMAANLYRQILEQNPEFSPKTYLNLGLACQQQQQPEEAISAYQSVLERDPGQVIAYVNLGAAFQELAQYEDAIAAYRQAIALQPELSVAYTNLGTVFAELQEWETAKSYHQQALQVDPKNAKAFYNLGIVAEAETDYAGAIQFYSQAIELDSNYVKARWNRSLLLLLLGQWEQGWTEYEWRWAYLYPQGSPCDYSEPRWDGSDLKGRRILLHAEQGLGDTLQFIRYVPIVLQRGGTIIVGCSATLKRLLASLPGISEWVTHGEALPPFDCYAPLLSLPGILGTTPTTIPSQVPYLTAPEVSPTLRLPESDQLKVGLVWASGQRSERPELRKAYERKSCPLAVMVQPLVLPGVQLYSLQVGSNAADLQAFADQVLDLSDRITDFADTAALVNQLDLVITVDTAVAHLAGALAKPVWLLLPHFPDWRWFLDREDTPWYPTMRLFRQVAPGNWSEVMARVGQELRRGFLNTSDDP